MKTGDWRLGKSACDGEVVLRSCWLKFRGDRVTKHAKTSTDCRFGKESFTRIYKSITNTTRLIVSILLFDTMQLSEFQNLATGETHGTVLFTNVQNEPQALCAEYR